MKMPKKANALVGEDKQLEDEEEGFLNPEDLSLIDELVIMIRYYLILHSIIPS